MRTHKYKKPRKEEIQELGHYVRRTTKPLSEISQEYGIGLRSLKRLKARKFYLEAPRLQLVPKDGFASRSITDTQSSEMTTKECLQQATSNLSKMLFQIVHTVSESGEIRGFNPKNTVDAVDKLSRLVADMGEGETVRIQSVETTIVNISKELILETILILERQHPSINGRDLIRTLFNEQLPILLKKYGIGQGTG